MRVALVSGEDAAWVGRSAGELGALGHEITIVGAGDGAVGGDVPFLPLRPLDVKVVPGFLEDGYRLARTLAQERFDAVVFADRDGSAYCAARLRRLGLGLGQTRVLVHASGPRAWRLEQDREVWLGKGDLGRAVTERLALELADGILCEREDLAAWLRRRWALEHVTPAPRGGARPEALMQVLEQTASAPAATGGAATPPSVVVSHHERPAYLTAALEGFAAQTVSPREVVVVDDGSVSPSASGDLAALEARSWPWPLRIVRRPHGGVHAARNAGFREAGSDTVLFFDDDDVPFPELVETVTRAHAASGADVVPVGARLFRGDGPPAPRSGDTVTLKLGRPYELGLLSNHYGGPVCLWSRSLLERIGGFRDAALIHEDWEILARATASGASVAAVPESLYWYRQLPGGLVNTNVAAKRAATLAAVAALFGDSLPPALRMLPGLAAGAYDRLEQVKRDAAPPGAASRVRHALGNLAVRRRPAP